jgi:hypothetical protein
MLQIHHINYRSQGGPDEVWNLILLCDAHHRLMHTSKRHWQPILRSVQAVYYFSNVRMSVRSAEKKLAWMAAGEPPDDGPDDAPE